MDTHSKREENEISCLKNLYLILFKCLCIEVKEDNNCTNVELEMYIIPESKKQDTIFEEDYYYVSMDEIPSNIFSLDINGKRNKVISDYV